MAAANAIDMAEPVNGLVRRLVEGAKCGEIQGNNTVRRTWIVEISRLFVDDPLPWPEVWLQSA
jgi:hypothetical protein